MKILCLNTVVSMALAFTLSFQAEAAQVSKVKGKAVLIETEGDIMATGELYFVVDLAGKRKGIVKISKVQGTKAIARLAKGQAQTGMSLVKRGASAKSRPSQQSYESDYAAPSSSSGDYRMSWGGMIGISSSSLTADIVTDTGLKQGAASTTGMGFSGMGLFDYNLFDQVWFRGIAGIENFRSTGPSSCGDAGTSACDGNIMYLSAGGIGRYLFSQGSIRPWAGGGVEILFPLSKSSSLLQTSSITSTYALIVSGGVDWHMNPTMYIPISLEYAMLPKSETVEASWIQVRAGLAWPF